MKYTQIRNATAHIHYANKTFLIDPVLAKKESYEGFKGTVNSHIKWPTVELPFSLESILNVDAVIITHTHPDHLDEVALQQIPKNMPLFVQNKEDKQFIQEKGFTNIQILTQDTFFEDIQLSITKGQHGSDKTVEILAQRLGEVCGVIFSHKNEKTMYLAGDTIWYLEVENAIKKYSPHIIILNAGDAQIPEFGSIIMGKEDILKAHKFAPDATIIATHMEAVNHAVLTRKELHEFITLHQIQDKVLIPKDGESLVL